MFNESNKNCSTLSLDTCFTDRGVIETGLKCQLDIGSSQGFTSPNNLKAAHQTAARMEVANKAKKSQFLIALLLKKFF